MNELIFHIEFLLHSHDCVIIPDLGGFVLNYVPAKRDGLSVFYAPSYEIAFNQELTHNDGLLAQSYMQTNAFSFQAATQKVEQAVREINQHLQREECVNMGMLGVLRMNAEKHLVFTPGEFVRPDVFGLSPSKLKPVIQMQTPDFVRSKQVNTKKTIRQITMATAAAAVIAFMMLVFPFTDTPRQQKAQILPETSLFLTKTAEVTPTLKDSQVVAIPPVDKNEILAPIATISPVESEKEQQATPVIVASNEKRYYVVVGVYEVSKSAANVLERLKADGFSQASSHVRAGRTDVYAASFTDRTTAEVFQRELQTQSGAYTDAWILKY